MNETIPIHHYQADKPGPHLVILAGIHGNEVCGPAGLKRLIEELDTGAKLDSGQLTIAPLCNPPAYRAGKPWLDGVNLNRMIDFYPEPRIPEQHFSNQIVRLIDKADIVLDLHSCVAKASAFSILDYRTPEGEALAVIQGLRHCVTGWVEMNAQELLSTQDTMNYAHSKGKSGLTIECGQNSDPEAVEVAYRCARRSLAHLGMMTNDNDQGPFYKAEVFKIDGVVINRGSAELIPEPVNLARVEAGQPIARYPDGSIDNAPFTGVMIMPSKTADYMKDLTYLARPVSGLQVAPQLTALLEKKSEIVLAPGVS